MRGGRKNFAGICIQTTRGQRGSALVLAMFSLLLLTSMGAVLLFVTETEMKSNRVDLDSKQSFFLAEAGLEHAREQLRVDNVVSGNPKAFTDELIDAAGVDGAFDIDVNTLKPAYNSNGAVTGFIGYDDDQSVANFSSMGQGTYMSFVTNDPAEAGSLTDGNDKAMITSIGTGPNGATEIVQGIVTLYPFPGLPATIVILGPQADFHGGNSSSKDYTGDDCSVPNLSVPVVGVIGSASKVTAETGVYKFPTFTSGSSTGVDTVEDIDSTIDPNLKDCGYLHTLADDVRNMAHTGGDSTMPVSDLGTPGDPKITFIDGDYDIPGGISGAGMLWVTGALTMDGRAEWYGTIYVVGKGIMERKGAGNGDISGAILVADVAGPDGIMWTSDDCAGEDGLNGTTDDGIASSTYHNDGGGTGLTQYCESAINGIQSMAPLPLVAFRQF